MAYCEQCGAYIPDGQTKCLACGYDESEKPKGNTAAAYAEKKDYSGSAAFDSEKLRRQLEEQREKQKENSRRWAEAERARREQQERSAAYSSRSTPYSETGYEAGKRSSGVYETNETSRWMGMLSYIWWLWLLPILFRRDDPFAMYHAKQGLLLAVVSAIGSVAGSIIGLGWVVTVARIFMIIKGINTAKEGKMEPLPYIGNIVSK